jgi:hypothetical protein
MTDYTKMTAHEMLQEVGDDAQKWAAAFCQTAEKLGHHGIDEGWMIGWFANAIEQSTTVRAARTPAPEGEAVAWLYTEHKWKDGPRHRLSMKRQPVSDEDANEYEITETPLYASPVVPVSRKEIARIIGCAITAYEDDPSPDCKTAKTNACAAAADTILAALGTKDQGSRSKASVPTEDGQAAVLNVKEPS